MKTILIVMVLSAASLAQNGGVVPAPDIVKSAGEIAQAAIPHARGTAKRKIMIFGGTDHKVYLGCLNCSEFAADSVRNSFGPHGSEFQPESIFNTFSQYGGTFSDKSPCSEFATHPPVIVDDQGSSYGELTINELKPKRTKSEIINKWIAGVCEDK